VPGVVRALLEWWRIVLAAAAVLPVAAAGAVLLSRRRVAGGLRRAEAARRSRLEMAMLAGTVPWLWLIFTPLPAERAVLLVPLRDLAVQVVDDPPRAVAQIGGNLLVFAAVGAFGPMRWPVLAGVGRLLAGGAVASIAVETTQHALDIGRVWSIDDVLLNALGAALGGVATRRWWARPSARAAGAAGRPVAG
jgi:hypothetical protein